MRYLLACLSLNYEGEEIQTRTFDRDRWYIASTFQADIDFDPHLKQYYLANPDYTSYYVKDKTYTYEVIPCFQNVRIPLVLNLRIFKPQSDTSPCFRADAAVGYRGERGVTVTQYNTGILLSRLLRHHPGR